MLPDSRIVPVRRIQYLPPPCEGVPLLILDVRRRPDLAAILTSPETTQPEWKLENGGGPTKFRFALTFTQPKKVVCRLEASTLNPEHGDATTLASLTGKIALSFGDVEPGGERKSLILDIPSFAVAILRAPLDGIKFIHSVDPALAQRILRDVAHDHAQKVAAN